MNEMIKYDFDPGCIYYLDKDNNTVKSYKSDGNVISEIIIYRGSNSLMSQFVHPNPDIQVQLYLCHKSDIISSIVSVIQHIGRDRCPGAIIMSRKLYYQIVLKSRALIGEYIPRPQEICGCDIYIDEFLMEFPYSLSPTINHSIENFEPAIASYILIRTSVDGLLFLSPRIEDIVLMTIPEFLQNSATLPLNISSTIY